jgi:hypothetical protein
MNYYDHLAALPNFYWTGETRMNCLRAAIGQSLTYAYAHHIQRLMVTGNFALLVGVHPDAADEWYLGIYIDAIQWVELPNTRAMSQFADGGLIRHQTAHIFCQIHPLHTQSLSDIFQIYRYLMNFQSLSLTLLLYQLTGFPYYCA